jgi:hypothetical protein
VYLHTRDREGPSVVVVVVVHLSGQQHKGMHVAQTVLCWCLGVVATPAPERGRLNKPFRALWSEQWRAWNRGPC